MRKMSRAPGSTRRRTDRVITPRAHPPGRSLARPDADDERRQMKKPWSEAAYGLARERQGARSFVHDGGHAAAGPLARRGDDARDRREALSPAPGLLVHR